jgi:hypothetical protein
MPWKERDRQRLPLPYLSALALPNKRSSPIVYRMSSFVLSHAVLYKEGKGNRRLEPVPAIVDTVC